MAGRILVTLAAVAALSGVAAVRADAQPFKTEKIEIKGDGGTD
jgi:hypothetical protein